MEKLLFRVSANWVIFKKQFLLYLKRIFLFSLNFTTPHHTMLVLKAIGLNANLQRAFKRLGYNQNTDLLQNCKSAQGLRLMLRLQ